MWVSSFIYSGIILNSFSRYYKAHITKAETASTVTKVVLPVSGRRGMEAGTSLSFWGHSGLYNKFQTSLKTRNYSLQLKLFRCIVCFNQIFQGWEVLIITLCHGNFRKSFQIFILVVQCKWKMLIWTSNENQNHRMNNGADEGMSRNCTSR